MSDKTKKAIEKREAKRAAKATVDAIRDKDLKVTVTVKDQSGAQG